MRHSSPAVARHFLCGMSTHISAEEFSMPTKTTFRSAALFALALAATACESDPAAPNDSLTVSGTIENRSGAPVPANARVIVAWIVTAGSQDYTYVFGEGTINPNGTFTVQLDDPPPTQALNNNDLGVGLILVTTNQTIGTGDDIDTMATTEFIGGAEDYGIIYLRDGNVDGSARWNAFDEGYNVGVGVRHTVGFDDFAPTSATGVRIIVDDIDNLDFVNWT
jgi:hypothetical protein